MSLSKIEQKLNELANPEKAKLYQRFFKTGKGEYGEGDIFLGIIVPQLRAIAKEFWKTVSLADIQQLLNTKIHEKRMIALVMLIHHYKSAVKLKDKELPQKIFNFFLSNTKNINNWDLVDVTCRDIIGHYLSDKTAERKILEKLALSKNLWERRIAIISTSYFIPKGDFADTLKIAEILLLDEHDLIHKAVGWMLREIGKRNLAVEEEFLQKHYRQMPRTMLRYAIEKFEEGKRRGYLRG